MSTMSYTTFWLFFVVFFAIWNSAHSGTFAGCFYVDNTTDSVSFYCKESTGTYPKTTCLSLLFSSNSWDVNRSAIRLLKISECKGTDLNRKLYKTFTNLREFDISFYGVQNLNSEVLTLKQLEKFNASHNKLTNIGGSIFSDAPNLLAIDFSYNKITKLFANDFFQATKLSTIDFSHNEISILGPETFRQLNDLKTLDLSTNLIRIIDKNQFNSNLSVLNLENNPIMRLDCNIFTILMRSTQVEFSWANIRGIDASCSKNVVEIELNRENDVVFRTPTNENGLILTKNYINNLRYFNITGNYFQNTSKIIELLGTSIEILDLSSNFVGKLNPETLKNLSNLQELNLSHTNLSNFEFKTFYNQRKLKILDISYNHLKSVDFTLFVRNFKALHTLNLEGNDLIEVNTITRSRFPKLITLGLSKNNFSCYYLANFLLQWENLTLFENPSDQTHIDGVDCHHDERISNGKKSYETAMDLESSAEDDKPVDTQTSAEHVRTFATEMPIISTTGAQITRETKSTFVNTSQKFSMSTTETVQHLSQTTNVGGNDSTDYRVVERILLVLCIVCCGFLMAIKTNAFEIIRQKVAQRSLDRNLGYQREDCGSQDLSFTYNGVTTL